MADFDFQQAVEVVLFRLGAYALEGNAWELETRAGILAIRVHPTWMQACFSNPREAVSLFQFDDIDPQTGRWDWHCEHAGMERVNAIEKALVRLIDIDKEKSLPILEKMMREFHANMRAKGTRIRFRKPGDPDELTATFLIGIPPAPVRGSTTQANRKLTIHPPAALLPPGHPFAQPAITVDSKRSVLPLVPKRPPDLEDIAFEILRQARYRKR